MEQKPKKSQLEHTFALIKNTIPPIHKGGYPIIGAAGLISLVMRRVSKPLGTASLLSTGAIALFFREPERVTPQRTDVIIAAADGEIALIEKALPPKELGLSEEPLTRISTFLSVLDVHVQRVPVNGTIKKIYYHPGKFLSADLDKASEDNERNSVIFGTEEGQQIIVTQIAGLLARRIVTDVYEKDHVKKGETYGLIRFGSRVDVYLPPEATPLVEVGQRAIGGETVLAQLI